MTNSSANSNGGAAELFHMLESNKLSDVEETKKVFHDHFLSARDNWLVSGLFDYYLSTDSLRAVEVLAGVREPHDKHLFDKLNETLAAKVTSNGQKIKTLVLLGHVARRQPTWLYKLASHTLFRQLLQLLKVEEDIVLLMSALLLLITLLPMLPTALTSHLQEIFEVFSRLALFHYNQFLSFSSANSTNVLASPTPTPHFNGVNDSDRLYYLHLQIGLQHLFHRLYAMYPCNFVAFLRYQYQRDQMTIFKKIISPMLDSVRMHPLLVTMSKESEISSSRWKKMEHHDVVAECGRFSVLEKSSRDETMSYTNNRFTPISDNYSCPYTPVSTTSEFPVATDLANGNQESFWSPSMTVPAHSPTPTSSLQATPISHDAKSTPSTPGAGLGPGAAAAAGAGGRSRISPPEAAVEATPETTPVKDLRQPVRQMPVGSAAVRALSSFGNGSGLLSSSRPSTPTSTSLNFNNHLHQPPQQHHLTQLQMGSSFSSLAQLGEGSSSIFDRKLGKILAERQNAQSNSARHEEEHSVVRRTLTPVSSEQQQQQQHQPPSINSVLNGRADSWQHKEMQLEDQEVSDIVSSKRTTSFAERDDQTLKDLSRKVRLKFYCKYPTPPVTAQIRRRSKSCPDVSALAAICNESGRSIGIGTTFRPLKPTSLSTEETSTQTSDVVPYECFLYDVMDQPRAQSVAPTMTADSVTPSAVSTVNESRHSPSAMLERYIEVCAQSSHHENKSRPSSRPNWSSGRRSKTDDEAENGGGLHTNDEGGDTGYWMEVDRAYQQIQLMQMQLQFERQRREVHAERNRRLLGKLRDSRALEELNSSMTHRLKLAENEVETLRSELTASKMEARVGENKLVETVHVWQSKCKEEQQLNSKLKDRIEMLEDELKSEKKKLMEHEKQTRAAEATLFEAAHQLKEALRAANQSEELKRVLDGVQKRFLLLGEAQAKIQEKMIAPVHMARQESIHIQRAWSEEVSNLRRQLDSQTLQLESLKSRLAEFEHKDARKEVQLVDQQRLLQESKEKHAAELEAVDSKYRAQLEINLLLEGRVLELHGKLEQATMCGSSGGASVSLNLASSVSPKERSPPLSASLASSSEGSLAFIHSAMNDSYCDTAGEIANLQAIVEPAAASQITPSTSSTTLTQQKPSTSASQQR